MTRDAQEDSAQRTLPAPIPGALTRPAFPLQAPSLCPEATWPLKVASKCASASPDPKAEPRSPRGEDVLVTLGPSLFLQGAHLPGGAVGTECELEQPSLRAL